MTVSLFHTLLIDSELQGNLQNGEHSDFSDFSDGGRRTTEQHRPRTDGASVSARVSIWLGDFIANVYKIDIKQVDNLLFISF